MRLPYPNSLKSKILFGYIISFFLMLIAVLINLNNFKKMSSTVLSGEVVAELVDTAFEIRRYEKNYFLYRKEKDLHELTRYLEKIEKILRENKRDIELFSQEGFTWSLSNDIKEYHILTGRLIKSKEEDIYRLEDEIRTGGKKIVKMAEDLAQAKKEKVSSILLYSRNILIISIIFLATAGFMAGAIFYRKFTKPLVLFEEHMKRIAEGEYSFIPVLTNDREMVSLSKAFNRMLVELELRQTHLIKTEKLASLGTLLFGIVHEINNPLNNIYTSCQILRKEIEGEDLEFKKELIGQIESETERAMDIVHSILDYSRAGKKEMVNLIGIIRESLRFIKSEISTKINVNIDIPLEINLFADPQQLKQVFLNLIKNSLDAIEGEGRIDISAIIKNHNVEIRITDTGKGIPSEILPRIFDPFFTTKEGRQGYGLGLFVTHNIIKEHEGSIDIQSSLGHGTTVLIKLPVKEAI